MRINYHPDTDSLYIDLSEHASVESREVQLERLVLTRMTTQIERRTE